MQKMFLATFLFFLSIHPLSAEEKPAMTNEHPIITLETTQGPIVIALRPDIAPKAVENFLKHAETNYYTDGIFHRVIKGFMIQGGDPTGTGRGGSSIWGKPFEDEFSSSLKFDKPGLLAMANAGPRTNGSQFFITTAAAPWLNNKHTIFGEVISGYDVVKKIEGTKTGAEDKPVEPQQIKKISIKLNNTQ